MNENLRQKELWVFDLDNTLYPESCDLFPQIEKLMGEFIMTQLSVDAYQAKKFQKEYYAKYGTTLAGLMANHEVNPTDYMDFVHNIDYSYIKPDLLLKSALENMNARKIIFTNGSVSHAKSVLKQLLIPLEVFDGIYDVCDALYTPKPAPEAFDRIFAKMKFDPKKSVMVEDIALNLQYPHEIGMHTILIKSSGYLDMNLVPKINNISDNIGQFIHNVYNN